MICLDFHANSKQSFNLFRSCSFAILEITRTSFVKVLWIKRLSRIIDINRFSAKCQRLNRIFLKRIQIRCNHVLQQQKTKLYSSASLFCFLAFPSDLLFFAMLEKYRLCYTVKIEMHTVLVPSLRSSTPCQFPSPFLEGSRYKEWS